LFGNFCIRIGEHKPDIQIRILLLDQDHFLAICRKEAAFRFDDDGLACAGLDVKVWGIPSLSRWDCVEKLVLFILKRDTLRCKKGGKVFF
jgi:hypothetical protein